MNSPADDLRHQAADARREHRLDEARDAYERAVAILRASDDPLRLAHTVRHLGDVLHELGDRDGAARCYDEALTLYREHPERPPLDLANALRSMAVLKEETQDLAEALSLWREAGQWYAVVNVAAGVDESARHVARLSAS